MLNLYREYFGILKAVLRQHKWLSEIHLIYEDVIATGTLAELNSYLRETVITLHKSFSLDTNVACQVKKYIDDNYHKQISTNSIAKDFCIDLRKLSREFSNAYGITLSKYITEVRMKRAMQLISTSDFLLYEIAEMVGYVNYESFSRVFYSYWGKWPKSVSAKKTVK